MRAPNLVKVAAQAELLRIQSMLKRQGRRAAFGLVALIFLVGALAAANVAGWQVARRYVEPIYATLIMLGVNLAIALIFGLSAARSSPGRDEREALEVRQRALREARSSLALGAVVPVGGALFRTWRNSRRKPRRLRR
jgi:ribose/xylose/arabinose/galactoside ABC-type transport system permease subunit